MPDNRPTVFISYSHKDEEWMDRLLPRSDWGQALRLAALSAASRNADAQTAMAPPALSCSSG